MYTSWPLWLKAAQAAEGDDDDVVNVEKDPPNDLVAVRVPFVC